MVSLTDRVWIDEHQNQLPGQTGVTLLGLDRDGFDMHVCFGNCRTMKEGPDISRIAALMGDPARANILTALIGGQALTPSELAQEAGITLPTVSGHLAKLSEGGLVTMRKQGRHRYVSLAGPEAAALIEALMGFAAGRGLTRVRPGPRDAALREARVCYNHLAGQRGVQMFDALRRAGVVSGPDDAPELTASGRDFVRAFGVDLEALEKGRAPLCRGCLDWSERRTHLAGSLGRALLGAMEQKNWLTRAPKTRAVTLSVAGARAFDAAFPRE